MGSSRRWSIVAIAGATVLAGCRVPGIYFPGHGPAEPSGVHITAPLNASQAPASGDVNVDVRLDADLDPATLKISIITGWPEPTSSTTLSSSRITRDGTGGTVALHAADLTPGLVTIRARAYRTHGDERESGWASISWEPDVAVGTAGRCDPIATKKCLMPFPNDFFTVADPSSATGRRVHFTASSMPVNSSGVAIDPTEWNRNDGFSPGAMIVTYAPGVDLAVTGAAPITDIGRSLQADQPIVLIDAATGERWPVWSELDSQADPANEPALIVRVAKNLPEGHRFIVAMRDLRTADGSRLPTTRGFALYRDNIPTFTPAIEARRPHMESVLHDLETFGIARGNLDLAWDFTVASEQNLAGRLLHIRDDAFASLNGAAPTFNVASVADNVDDRIFRRVTGTFTVPNYLTGDGSPGNRFKYAPGAGVDALPIRNGNLEAQFICNIPRSISVDGNDPVTRGRGAIYGHGLLGSQGEVNAGNVRTMADDHRMVYCATKWSGFADEDISVAVQTLQDVSNFPKVADRTQQGFLNQLFLARLVKDPNGFAANAAFRLGASATPVLDGSVFYDGNSQGGILGGALTAVATDFTRAVLGVPGMNYSTLLQRSSDFETYKQILNPAYPNELDRVLWFSVVQMLWDRAEANGYAEHLTDHPYPGTPRHSVLYDVAFGDHQVANVTAEVAARTVGARILLPGLAAGRSPDVVPFWGITPISFLPWNGSAIVYWDSGNPHPPLGNVAPTEPEFGSDPHEFPRRTPAAQQQKSDFLQNGGVLVDTCGGQACLAPPG
ncbi:MAG: hypothetical protein JJE46_04135 [Acidimicrobiia bacterium]|nr:hypothetical protein [Acidimicrobiia bacterium]